MVTYNNEASTSIYFYGTMPEQEHVILLQTILQTELEIIFLPLFFREPGEKGKLWWEKRKDSESE